MQGASNEQQPFDTNHYLESSITMNRASKNDIPPYSPDFLTQENYDRATHFLPKKNTLSLVKNATVTPHWLENSNIFWYKRDTNNGHEFLLIDADKASRSVAFDHKRIAGILSKKTGETITENALPISDLSFTYEKEKGITQLKFNALQHRWIFTLPEYNITLENIPLPTPKNERISPNGLLHVFRRNFNLWVLNKTSGQEQALTIDGEEYNEYGWYSGNSQYHITAGLLKEPPLVLFSPDSKKLVTERVDEREVDQYSLWQGAPENNSRPIVHEARLSFAGDKHRAKRTLVIIDIETGYRHNIDQSLTQDNDIGSVSEKLESGQIWWSNDSQDVYFLSTDRYFKTLRLSMFNLETKVVSPLIEETSSTQVNMANTHSCIAWPAMKILSSGDILWFSERTGWGHFYRYDREGNFKNAVTKGDWSAYEVVFIDEERELAYILGAGREPAVHPYYRQLYQVPLDGSTIQLLTPGDTDHAEPDQFHQYDKGRFFSPKGDYFVDTWSTSNTPPRSAVKTTKGEEILELELADINGLFPDNNWPHRPEIFQVKARDGKTTIYGEIFKPSHFNPDYKYPIIDHIYSSPYFICPSWPAFTSRFWGLRQAYAELGFIVVVIHGLGTCGRSKAFHEYSYGNLQDSGIADHVSAIEQLAEQHSYIDIDRVGIFGGSTGGYNTVLAMQDFPDFFKVGITSVPGVDHPHLTGDLVERWQGPATSDGANYDALVLSNRVAEIKGKLLIVFGDMDENVPMHTVVKFLDSMTKNNKDYDLIYLPNVDHWASSHPYHLRRSWDYFVRHLLGSKPPTEYKIEH